MPNQQKNQELRRKIRSQLGLTFLFVFSLLFTLFVLLNAYEQVFVVDIPYIQTLRLFKHSDVIWQIDNKYTNTATYEHPVMRDVPRFITLSSISSSVELTPALEKSNLLYVRGNKAHFLKTPNSNVIIVYFDAGWRTSEDTGQLKANDLVFLMSQDYTYVYKVDQQVSDVNLLPTVNSKDLVQPLLIVVVDNGNSYNLIQAELINSLHR